MTVRIAKPSVNIREKLAELERPIGLNGQALLATETPQQAFDLLGAGRRNLIINGDMRISQRGTSFVNPSSDQYTLDRFFKGSTTSNFTLSQGTSTLPSGKNVNTLDCVCNSSVSHWLDTYQGIEDFKLISGQTITLSAWVKTNHPDITFRQYSTKNIGNTFIPDGQWRYYTATTTLGSITSLTRGANSPYFGITNTSTSSWTTGQYVQFTEFQIEVGKVATPFEYRSIGEELALCQRYYQEIGNGNNGSNEIVEGGYGTNAMSVYNSIQLPVEMRTVPTLSQVGTLYTVNIGQPGSLSGHVGRKSFSIANTVTSAGTWVYATSTSAYFTLSAEL